MKRVLVIGSGGAGKSTLARKLGVLTGLPVIHLDRIYWRAGWKEAPTREFEADLDAALAGDAWIIDGDFSRTLQRRLARADAAIWLDYTRLTCLAGALWRVRRWHGRTRADLPDGCPEQFSLSFLHWIWTYPRRSRAHVAALLARFETAGGRVVRLRTRGEAREWLTSVESASRDAAAGRDATGSGTARQASGSLPVSPP